MDNIILPAFPNIIIIMHIHNPPYHYRKPGSFLDDVKAAKMLFHII